MNKIVFCFTLLSILPVSALTANEPRQISTIAGTGVSENNGNSGDAINIGIGNPFGVELGPDGALYICEVDFHRVRRLDLKTGMLTTVAGTGEKGYSGDGGPATKAKLNEPYEVRFDSAGNMFFVEMQNHLVRKVDHQTGIISTVAGCGEPGYGGDGGPALQAKMKRPHSITLDFKGNLYIADIGNHRIRVVDLTAGTIETLAGNGERTLPKEGETVKGKPLLGPRALTMQDETLWIALREGHSVWKLEMSSGLIHHVAGTGKKGFNEMSAPAKSAMFNGPKGIAIGPEGNVYVVDTENQVIRKINIKNNTVSTVAGSGPQVRGAAGDHGPATSAEMNRPHGICVGPKGTVYIGDSENHRVRMVR